jgi:hypothetical protein
MRITPRSRKVAGSRQRFAIGLFQRLDLLVGEVEHLFVIAVHELHFREDVRHVPARFRAPAERVLEKVDPRLGEDRDALQLVRDHDALQRRGDAAPEEKKREQGAAQNGGH